MTKDQIKEERARLIQQEIIACSSLESVDGLERGFDRAIALVRPTLDSVEDIEKRIARYDESTSFDLSEQNGVCDSCGKRGRVVCTGHEAWQTSEGIDERDIWECADRCTLRLAEAQIREIEQAAPCLTCLVPGYLHEFDVSHDYMPLEWLKAIISENEKEISARKRARQTELTNVRMEKHPQDVIHLDSGGVIFFTGSDTAVDRMKQSAS